MARVSLAMYDMTEVQGANDALWSGIAKSLRKRGLDEVPNGLDRETSIPDALRAPDLLLGQTCGYPLIRELAGRVELVATPCYEAAGCDGSNYSSWIVVGADNPAHDVADLAGMRCAVNGANSQSGYNALRALVAPYNDDGLFFGAVEVSGGHANSLAMVQNGTVDVAAIDGVMHAMCARHRPAALDGTRVLTRTAAVPGLPYVTAGGTASDAIDRLRDALDEAMADPNLADARDALLLSGIEVLPLSAYDPVHEMEVEAERQGYPVIA